MKETLRLKLRTEALFFLREARRLRSLDPDWDLDARAYGTYRGLKIALELL